MSYLDIIFLAVIGIMTAYGIWRGMISQILSIAGIIIGFMLASQHYIELANHLKFTDPNLSKIVSFILIFIACVLAAAILAWLLNKIFRLPGLGIINSFLGGVVGFLKGFLLVAIVTLILITMVSAENPVLSKSLTLPYILKAIRSAESWIPKDLKENFHKKINPVLKETPPEPPQKKKK
jgi:membrane protein required for colicin V production